MTLLVAMGYVEDGWNSSRFWTDQLHGALVAHGFPTAQRFAPRLGRHPRWWDRRLFYSRKLPPADIVQFMDQSYADALLSVRRPTKSVALIHDIDFWRSRKWWNTPIRRRIREGLARADRRVAVSQATALEIQTHLGLKVDAVIAPGFDDKVFAHWDGPREAGLLLHVGTLGDRKGPDRLLRCLAGLPPSWRLLQLGGTWQPVEQGLIEELKLKDRIEQRAQVDRETLREAYRRAAVAIFPSRYEGFGLPPVEARLVGTRVWVSDAVPCAEHFGSDPGAAVFDGKILDSGGSDGERKRLCEAIAAVPAQAVAFARRDFFSWGRAAEEFGRLYRELLKP